MTRVNNAGLNLAQQKIVNPFKTSRSSAANPFKYSNFEGNTLQFADVFEGFETKKAGRLKMISSAAAGSMTKLYSGITEPILNFVNRIKDGLSGAWNYAKSTNISDTAGIKTVNKIMSTDILDIGKGLSDSVSGLGKNISGKMSFLNTDITDIGKVISNKWSDLTAGLQKKKISPETPVSELKAMWENEILLAEREAV